MTNNEPESSSNDTSSSTVRKSFRTDRDAIDRKRLPLAVKVFGVLCLVAGGATAVLLTITIVTMVLAFTSGNLDVEASTATVIIYVVETVLYTALATMFAVFGIRLLRNKRKHAAHGTEAMIFILAAIIICSIMLNGLGANVIPHAVVAVFLIVMQSYLDPALAGERELRRKLRDMETREQAEDGTLGLDPTGRGYITLNFFNLFWIFVVCSVLGLVIETVYHVLVVDPGVYEDRAGLLFGPFSPIYGVGAMLMTMALNRFHKASFPVIFLVSAVDRWSIRICSQLVHAVRLRHRCLGLHRDVPLHRRPHQRHVHGHVGRAWPVLGEAVPALDAATGQSYPLELALFPDHRMRRLDDRRLRHDIDVARPLVPA